jgi:hypothetical protein
MAGLEARYRQMNFQNAEDILTFHWGLALDIVPLMAVKVAGRLELSL